MKQIKAIGNSLLITFSFILFIGIFSSIAMMTIPNALTHATIISAIVQVLYLLLILSIFYLKKIDFKQRCSLAIVPYHAYLIPTLAAFSFSVSSNLFQEMVPVPEALTSSMEMNITSNPVSTFLTVLLIAPIVEETVFRGLIMTKLRQSLSVPCSIVISALLFGVIHIMAGGFITVLHAFLGGLIFGMTYEKTKSLIPAIVAHIFGNLGGIAYTVITDSSTVVQAVVGSLLLILTTALCVMLYRKDS